MKRLHQLCILLAIGIAGIATCSCTPKSDAPTSDSPSPKEPASHKTFFPIKLGDKTLQLQLALTDVERTMGLMFRQELGQDDGMLFLFEKPAPRGFWMRNTQIPLDLGYFDASGKLLEIHKLYPFDETPVPSKSQQVLIVVETNRGWFAANGIGPGARVDIDALVQAVEDRGLSIKRFQIDRKY